VIGLFYYLRVIVVMSEAVPADMRSATVAVRRRHELTLALI